MHIEMVERSQGGSVQCSKLGSVSPCYFYCSPGSAPRLKFCYWSSVVTQKGTLYFPLFVEKSWNMLEITSLFLFSEKLHLFLIISLSPDLPSDVTVVVNNLFLTFKLIWTCLVTAIYKAKCFYSCTMCFLKTNFEC